GGHGQLLDRLSSGCCSAQRRVSSRMALVAVAVAALLAGCGGSGGSGGSSADSGMQPSIGEPATTSPVRAAPGRPTRPVLTREGPCPYFGLGSAMQTIGQHLAGSTVTSTRPSPGCPLYRPDGGKAIDAAHPGHRAVAGRAVPGGAGVLPGGAGHRDRGG